MNAVSAPVEPPIYTFRVRILGCLAGIAPANCREIQREIEIAANQTLTDLAWAITEAYRFTDPHLWSFYLSSKRWDKRTEHSRNWAALQRNGGFPDDPVGSATVAEIAPEEIVTAYPRAAAFAAPFLASLSQETRDEVRHFLELPPSEGAEIEADFVAAFLADYEDESLAAMEAKLTEDDPTKLAAISAEMATAIRDGIRITLDQFAAIEQMERLFSGGVPGDLFQPQLPAGDADATRICDVPFPGKTGKKEFLFLFDYGDEWEFGVKLLGTKPTKAPRARYPRVSARQGRTPQQYPPASWFDDVDPGDRPTAIIASYHDPTTNVVHVDEMYLPASPRKRTKKATTDEPPP